MINLAWNEDINRYKQHIDVIYHFVRDGVSRGNTHPEYTSTSENVASTVKTF